MHNYFAALGNGVVTYGGSHQCIRAPRDARRSIEVQASERRLLFSRLKAEDICIGACEVSKGMNLPFASTMCRVLRNRSPASSRPAATILLSHKWLGPSFVPALNSLW